MRYRSSRLPLRLTATLALSLAFLLYRLLLPQPSVTCIYDAYHALTEADNRRFVQGGGSAYQGNNNQLTITGKAIIGTGQVLMDLWILFIGVLWLVKIRNVRAFGGIAGFYLTRGVIFLNVARFPFPDDMAWRSPGFFSITVPYDHTRDFFYSGHTGGLTVVFLQMVQLGLKWPALLSFLSLIYMMNMLLMTKVHYVIDIIGGLVFAVFFHRLADRRTSFIDKTLSLPHRLYRFIRERYCSDEEEGTSEAPQPNDGSKDSENKLGEGIGEKAMIELVEISSDKEGSEIV